MLFESSYYLDFNVSVGLYVCARVIGGYAIFNGKLQSAGELVRLVWR